MLSKWPHLRAMHAFGSWELIENCLVSFHTYKINKWWVTNSEYIWDWDGARWGMGQSTLNDFIFRKLLGQGNEEAKSMWGRGEFDEIFLNLWVLNVEFPVLLQRKDIEWNFQEKICMHCQINNHNHSDSKCLIAVLFHAIIYVLWDQQRQLLESWSTSNKWASHATSYCTTWSIFYFKIMSSSFLVIPFINGKIIFEGAVDLENILFHFTKNVQKTVKINKK